MQWKLRIDVLSSRLRDETQEGLLVGHMAAVLFGSLSCGNARRRCPVYFRGFEGATFAAELLLPLSGDICEPRLWHQQNGERLADPYKKSSSSSSV